jgi:hypothetical protein
MFFTAKKRCSRQKGVWPRAASRKNQFYREPFVVDGKTLFCPEQLLAKSFFFYGRRENDLCRKFKPNFESVINSNKKLIIKFHYFSRCTTFVWVNSSFDKVIIILFTKPISLV